MFEVIDMIKSLFVLSENLPDQKGIRYEGENPFTNPFEPYNDDLFCSFKVTTLIQI